MVDTTRRARRPVFDADAGPLPLLGEGEPWLGRERLRGIAGM